MSGIPVDLLVDIDGSYGRFAPSSEKCLFQTSLGSCEPMDDPFEMCSMSNKINGDYELELGLALEKSIKLQSQCSWTKNSDRGVKDQQLDLGILVNLDDSPEKKTLDKHETHSQADNSSKEVDTVFSNPSNPFQLAWDVIEQEARNLADHIQYDKEKPNISPRKMVEMAMWQSPDSPLISPTKNSGNHSEAAFLIKSSPDLERRTIAKTRSVNSNRGRSSLATSPAMTKSCTTPLKSRASIQNSPLRRTNQSNSKATSSPVKTATTKGPFKAPLIRPSVSVPLGCASATKPGNTGVSNTHAKSIPMKAIHGLVQQPGPTPRQAKPTSDSPLRSSRASTSSTPSRTPNYSSVTPSLSTKQNRPLLMRAGSDLTQQLLRKSTVSMQHQNAGRRPSTSSTPSLPMSSNPPSTPSAQSKLRIPLSRTDSSVTKSVKKEVPGIPRQGSLRSGISKRVSFCSMAPSALGPVISTPGTVVSGNISHLPTSKSSMLRLKTRCKENLEP